MLVFQSLGGVPREHAMLKGHGLRVVYHQADKYEKMKLPCIEPGFVLRVQGFRLRGQGCGRSVCEAPSDERRGVNSRSGDERRLPGDQ